MPRALSPLASGVLPPSWSTFAGRGGSLQRPSRVPRGRRCLPKQGRTRGRGARRRWRESSFPIPGRHSVLTLKTLRFFFPVSDGMPASYLLPWFHLLSVSLACILRSAHSVLCIV